MATFSGNAAGYRVDFLEDGQIKVVDIDASNGNTGTQIIEGSQVLRFDDQSYKLGTSTDLQVNTTSHGIQSAAATTALADGGFVVTWTSNVTGFPDIYAQRYDAAGNAIGGETRVNSESFGLSSDQPAIATLTDGSYIIAWSVINHDANPTNDIHAQRYDASGNAIGGETPIATGWAPQDKPSIAALTDGGYVVSWTAGGQNISGDDIFAQRFDAAGNKIGVETRINTATAGFQDDSQVIALADGGYVVTWLTWGSQGSDGIYAQRFNAAGETVGGEARVNTTAFQYQIDPAITALKDGGYVIAWHAPDADDGGIYAQRYDATGAAVGSETRINASTAGGQSEPAITGLSDGGYLITWVAPDGDDDGIFTQRYDAAGNAVGKQAFINMTTHDLQMQPSVTALADGAYVISWTSWGAQDGNSAGVYARYFDASGDSKEVGHSLAGNNADNAINGGQGMQLIEGYAGDDVLNGGLGDDIVDGGIGNDVLNGGQGNDYLQGNAGNDTLVGGAGGDVVRGNAGDDVLNGGDGVDGLFGGRGNDTLAGGAANDGLQGGGGDDVVNGGTGDDSVHGAKGNDTLNGGTGNDRLSANQGSDTLNGGTGDDALWAGAGNDTLNGGDGSDFLSGGDGSDTFVFNSALGSTDTISEFSAAQGDTIQLENAVFASLADAGALAPGHFAANLTGKALDADDFIVYNTDTGELFYDADGNGAGAKVQIALIGTGHNHPVLTAGDFEVV